MDMAMDTAMGTAMGTGYAHMSAHERSNGCGNAPLHILGSCAAHSA